MKATLLPTWRRMAEGVARKAAVRFQASLAAYYEHEDLMQEAYLCFHHVRSTYPDVVDHGEFLRMYAIAVHRWLISLGRKAKPHTWQEMPEDTEALLPDRNHDVVGTLDAVLDAEDVDVRELRREQRAFRVQPREAEAALAAYVESVKFQNSVCA